jgi:ubiquinone/menaquinone biosynthesis C-methylase UbiE
MFGAVCVLAPSVVSAQSKDELDPMGRAMLDSLRVEALHPADLVARLRLQPDAIVADVGAGPGFLTLPLAQAVPRGKVIATDVRADYLVVAARRAVQAGRGNVKTLVVAPEAPGLEPHSVDVAILCQVDHYLRDRVRYLTALVQAMRPGGRIVLVNYARHRDANLAAAHAAFLRVVDEWNPSPPFFAVILVPDAERK